MRNVILKSAVALAVAMPLLASAESAFTTGAAANITASARVNFSIVIPRFVSLRVGPVGGTLSTITFSPTGAQLDAGTPVAGTGGDAPPGAVNVTVRGNDGAIALTATSPPNLTSGADNIPITQITTASSNVAGLAAPSLVSGVSAPVAPTVAAKITNQSAVWTYTYTNSTVAAAGTYTGQVTYTATLP